MDGDDATIFKLLLTPHRMDPFNISNGKRQSLFKTDPPNTPLIFKIKSQQISISPPFHSLHLPAPETLENGELKTLVSSHFDPSISMATSAFKSTTKRTPIAAGSSSSGDSASSRAHRRSRSLSRFSHRLTDSDEAPSGRGRFVNTMRGSEFPEVSLDDLAIELFLSNEEKESESDRGRPSSRRNSIAGVDSAAPSQRRGRSVSRQSSRVNGEISGVSNGSTGGRAVFDANSRRRRSMSVSRHHISDSESEVDHPHNNQARLKNSKNINSQVPLSHPTASNRRLLGRSSSQKDLLKSHNENSSQSSGLTDDEGKDNGSIKNGIEKTIRAVYSQKAEHPTGEDVGTGLYAAMRNELRHAVKEIRMELEQVMVTTKTSPSLPGDLASDNCDVVPAVSKIRRNYTTKLEQSEKRKQDLLAEIVLEEQRGRELSKIVKELLPDSKKTGVVGKPSRVRKKSNDRVRMSTRLNEEAEKYLEDFIANVEDTDISSFDGERSDASSTLGPTKPLEPLIPGNVGVFQSPVRSNSLPVETDGVVLPWLQWETTNGSPPPVKNTTQITVAQDSNLTPQNQSKECTSSRGSWSPGARDSASVNYGEEIREKYREIGNPSSKSSSGVSRGLRFDVDDYLKLQSSEDLLIERCRQQRRINSGGLLLCNSFFF